MEVSWLPQSKTYGRCKKDRKESKHATTENHPIKETEQGRRKGLNNYKTAKTQEQNAILNPYLPKIVFIF